ncbi:SGNH/GDSL hydrolase family protein [Chitinophaga alhagiae]|uniref:SGNH/GDSL hydrolase family protein n=1 Tax=Chitinophaga alhagiae TaxID=2203219 RepID=A0ABN5LLP9_9BACT|nr:SGNH/GDSL hydrolase family protein [Chitinophaga alhagiae]AWO00316.1 SGNH/GDSL hydrolase family protein [Chitinophaga alhagiae]
MKFRVFSTWALLSLVFGFQTLLAQERTVNWKGFEKVQFRFQDRDAFYIKPMKALPGNPWVWRAHFPDWHTEMDSILVTRGFHVAYVNTNNLFGLPQAMQVWDAFYEHLVKERKLAPKVALEGVSRGGLYVYGWAKRNPGKVSCIYAEAPVCDPNSWPGGKGKGKGAPAEWAKWLQLAGQTEATAADYADIPLKDLAGLAAFKVPVLHVIGLRDAIVPPDENTLPLVKEYTRLGGPAAVYPMTRGKQNLEGHHFPIEHPERLADFIYSNSVPVQAPLQSSAYVKASASLAGAFRKFEETKKGTVAFLGGSITHNKGWRNKVAQYLQERFPHTTFQFIAAGIPSLGSTPHAFRFSRDVLEKGTPDILFLEAAVNDRGNGFSEKEQVRALEGILRRLYQQNAHAAAVLMAFADPAKNADYTAGKEPVEVAVHKKIAEHYNASFINLSREVYDRIQAGEFSWEYDFKDLHPSPFGQEIYFQTMKTLLRQPPAAQPAPAKLPPKLDARAYDKGRYLAVAEARQLKGFTVTDHWKPADHKNTREGFVDIPVLEGEAAGASFELAFSGRAIGLAVIAGPDAGTIRYRVDRGAAKTVDLYTPWSKNLHLPWYLVLDGDLRPGRHTLHVEILPQSNNAGQGPACRIAYFLVNE